MSFVRCPCCGADMPTPPDPKALDTLPLGGSERELLGYYVASYPRALPTQRIVSRLWQLDPNGGPGDPRNGVNQRVFSINKSLRKIGWQIIRYGADSRKLERLDA